MCGPAPYNPRVDGLVGTIVQTVARGDYAPGVRGPAAQVSFDEDVCGDGSHEVWFMEESARADNTLVLLQPCDEEASAALRELYG